MTRAWRKLRWMAVLTTASAMWGCPQPAWADTPAVTDFGQVQTVEAAAVAPSSQAHAALFLTWYEDGHVEAVTRWVRDDAMAGFAGPHPAWRRNDPLGCWFAMPVYERIVRLPAEGDRVFL
ncbi:MAG: hypothetical protein IRZ10_00305 [Thermoflavifilum sp.]|nr:hypothetical protein [Thermoflavifilum sp.]MCL6512828.1 hypothetical protein [Alicyclobacillus sp.]